MKVAVKDIKPNPYRNMKHYPINQNKIEALKNSIQKTGFWDNIVARKVDKWYEIAYGHHRMQAVRELKIEYIDIPIRELDDSTMLLMMADENMNEWQSDPSIIIETVKAVKTYLESELAKYGDWEELTAFNIKSSHVVFNFKDSRSFTMTKEQGVGAPIILSFLNGGKDKGNWSQSQISEALIIINGEKNENIDSEAILELSNFKVKKEIETVDKNGGVKKKEKEEGYNTISYASKAAKLFRDNEIPKEKQKALASKIKEKLQSDKYRNMKTGIGSERSDFPDKEEKFEMAINETISDEGYENIKQGNSKNKKSGRKDIQKAFLDYSKYLGDINTGINEIFKNWDIMDKDGKKLFLIELNMFIEIINENKEIFRGEKAWKLLE